MLTSVDKKDVFCKCPSELGVEQAYANIIECLGREAKHWFDDPLQAAAGEQLANNIKACKGNIPKVHQDLCSASSGLDGPPGISKSTTKKVMVTMTISNVDFTKLKEEAKGLSA